MSLSLISSPRSPLSIVKFKPIFYQLFASKFQSFGVNGKSSNLLLRQEKCVLVVSTPRRPGTAGHGFLCPVVRTLVRAADNLRQ